MQKQSAKYTKHTKDLSMQYAEEHRKKPEKLKAAKRL